MPYSKELEDLDALSVKLTNVSLTISELKGQVEMMKLQILLTSVGSTTMKSIALDLKPSRSNTDSSGTTSPDPKENATTDEPVSLEGVNEWQ